METRDPEVEKKYKELRNTIRSKTRCREQEEQQDIALECKVNPKKFWAYIKAKTKINSTAGDIEVTDADGVQRIITDSEEKSNTFADYFSTVFNHEPDIKFETLNKVQCTVDMPKLVITDEKVYSKLCKLSIDKSPGPDLIHPRILKELSLPLCKPLAHLFNLSLLNSKLPEDWRESNVTTIHKK